MIETTINTGLSLVESQHKNLSRSTNHTNKISAFFNHHANQILKGALALGGLAVLGTAGYLLRGVFAGSKAVSTKNSVDSQSRSGETTAEVSKSALVQAEQAVTGVVAGIGLNSGLMDFSQTKSSDASKTIPSAILKTEAEEPEEIITSGARKTLESEHKTNSLKRVSAASSNQFSSSKSLLSNVPTLNSGLRASATATKNLVVNGTIPDQMLDVGTAWEGSINMTELFGEPVTQVRFSLVDKKPFPDWLSISPTLIEPGVTVLKAARVCVSGNVAYVAAYDQGLRIINITDSRNPGLLGSLGDKSSPVIFSAYAVTVSGDVAYVAAYDQGLKIINITDSRNPGLLGSLGDESSPVIFSAYAVTVSGNVAYVAAHNQGLKIINITDSRNPGLLSSSEVFVVNEVAVSGDVAYVAAGSCGLQIIDVSNSSNPFPIGLGVSDFDASGVAVNGNLAYVLSSDDLRIIDVSNSNNPLPMGRFGKFNRAVNRVTVNGNLAYVAAGGDGLKIINVMDSKNPFSMSSLAWFEAEDVTISGNLVYVVSYDSLKIIDLSYWKLFGMAWESKCLYQLTINADNAAHDTLSKMFNIWTNNFPRAISTVPSQSLRPGDNLTFNLKSTLIFDDKDRTDTLSLIMNSLPKAIWLKLNILPFAMNTNTKVTAGNNICISGNLAYVATGHAFEIIDVTASSNPFLKASIGGEFGSPGEIHAEGVTVSGNLAYVASGGKMGLQIFNITNSSNPLRIGYGVQRFDARRVTVSGNLAYVAAGGDGLKIIDIADSEHPRLIGTSMDVIAGGVSVSGNMAYVASTTLGLRIIDVSNSSAPFLKGSIGGFWEPEAFSAQGISVIGNLAYVAAGGDGLKIINVTDISKPLLIGSLGLEGFYANEVSVSGNLAYVSTGKGLKIIDVSSSNAPLIVGELTGLSASSTALQSNKAYCIGYASFDILDVTNYQLTGTPQPDDVGNYKINLIATDPLGSRASTSFTIRVEGGPILNTTKTIPPQIAPVGKPFYSFLGQGTFYDPNNDVITYESRLANGKELPSFLSFNPSSATYGGTPNLVDKGNYLVSVFASDRIVEPPTEAKFLLLVQDGIPDQFVRTGRETSLPLPLPSNLSLSAEGRNVTFAVRMLDNNSTFPEWLRFSNTSGQPCLITNPNVSVKANTYVLKITVNDGNGEAFFPFNLQVVKNLPPVATLMIPAQEAYAGKKMEYLLPEGVFRDADPEDNDKLVYSADLSDAGRWLKFDSRTRTFTGTPGSFLDAYIYLVRRYSIKVTAKDPSNETAEAIFELRLNGPSFWENLVTTLISAASGVIAVYGYMQKKHLLWDYLRKNKYQRPLIELSNNGNFSYQLAIPAQEVSSIIVAISHERACAKKMLPCLKKTLNFLPIVKNTVADIKTRTFPCTSVYLFPWLFYDAKTNVLRTIEGGPTREFNGKDINIKMRGTDNRIMEEFRIKIVAGYEIVVNIALQHGKTHLCSDNKSPSSATTTTISLPRPAALPRAFESRPLNPLYEEKNASVGRNPNALFAQHSEIKRAETTNEKELTTIKSSGNTK